MGNCDCINVIFWPLKIMNGPKGGLIYDQNKSIGDIEVSLWPPFKHVRIVKRVKLMTNLSYTAEE